MTDLLENVQGKTIAGGIDAPDRVRLDFEDGTSLMLIARPKPERMPVQSEDDMPVLDTFYRPVGV